MRFTFRSLCAAAALACALTPAAAQSAGKVLFLSTKEIPQAGPGGPAIHTYAHDGFKAAAGAGNVIYKPDALSDGTLTAADFNGVDVVVALSVYSPMDANARTLLQNVIRNRPDITVAMFLDGCCQQSTNLRPMHDFLKTQMGAGWAGSTLSSSIGTVIHSTLNANSPYSASFAALAPLDGEAYELMQAVPVQNALYLGHNAPLPASTATHADAYGVIVPQKTMNGGDGACTMLISDTSHFTRGAGQNIRLAEATLKAARDTAGSCKANPVEFDLSPVISGPSSLTPGAAQNYSVTVRNVGGTAIGATPGSIVTVTLPAGMEVAPGSFPASCNWAAPNLTCTGLPAIAAGGNAPPITFNAITHQNSATLKAVVANVPGEVNRVNNTSDTSANGAPGAPGAIFSVGVHTPVPTLDVWALGALAGLLGLFGARRQRKQAA